jgi:uncharacterized membrane protein YfcA
MLATPLLALAIPPTLATGVLLPILIVQDALSVWSFRRTWDRRVVRLMAPSAAVGIGVGFLFAASVPPAAVSLVVGAVSIAFAGYQLLRRAPPLDRAARHPPTLVGIGCGVTMGFTSHITHAGVPPFQIYVTQLGLSRDEFIGTSAVMFAIVNWLKVPAYVALGQLSRPALELAAVLLPLALVSTLVGLWLVRRVRPERFFRVVHVLLLLVGMKLTFDALT